MSDSMDLNQELIDGVLLLRLKGRLDAITAPMIEKRIFELIEQPQNQLIINFSQVNYLSSAGMRTLLQLHNTLKAKQGKLILSQIASNVLDVLKMSGFDHVLNLCATDQEALSSF